VYKASFALSLSLALVLGFGAPAGAAESPFEDGAEKAVKKVAPGLKRVERDTRQSRSVLDADQKIKEDTVTFRGNGRVVAVMRAVGAVAPVNGETVAGRAKQRKTVKAKRARVGTRKVLIYKTGEGGPGLTIAAWTERTGVNYQIVSRDGLSRSELVKLVKALPADDTRASRKARRAIEKAPPAAPQPEVTQRSTSSLFVDGAGDPKDDFGDEANLCNGCSYSHSNYVWLWQRILMADAYLQGSLDCSFGSLTAAGTKNWQGAHGLTKDGVVGKQTRTVADNFLVDLGGSSVRYLGLAQNILFDRLTSNAYYYGSKRINYTNATLC
jgi:peptidoglycan hydrolase-like protein with peptidoglycan-binding domain